MPVQTLILPIPLNGTGTEIPALNTTDQYDLYLISGTAIAIGNYAIVPTGTPLLGTTYDFKYRATVDITTHSTTFSLFGVTITQAQLLKGWDATCYFNGSTWDVDLRMSFAEAAIISSSNLGQIVVNANIPNGSIDLGLKGTTLSLDNTKIIANTIVGSQKIAASTITNTEINDVDGSKITNSTVTNSKLAVMADQTIKGNISGGSTNPSDISISTLFNGITWSILGNSGTIAGTNFIGTTDNVDLIFKRNNTLCGQINNTLTTTSWGNGASLTASGNLISAFGASAAFGASGSSITAIGFNSGLTSSGSNITALGYYSAVSATNSHITCIGENTIATGDYGIALGENASAGAAEFALPDNVTKIKFRGTSYTLPATDGTNGQKLTTNGSGVLSWT